MRPPGSLHDRMVNQWPYVRSYVIQNGHLFLSLMADGGIYEFEPMSPEGTVEGAVRGTATFRERMALPPGAVLEATLNRLSLGRMAGTMMACAGGLETERAFLSGLGRVSGWRVAGQQLELLDAAAGVVARFEARPME